MLFEGEDFFFFFCILTHLDQKPILIDEFDVVKQLALLTHHMPPIEKLVNASIDGDWYGPHAWPLTNVAVHSCIHGEAGGGKWLD